MKAKGWFLMLLGLMFIALKLMGYINWLWLWVLLPLYLIPLLIILLSLVIVVTETVLRHKGNERE